MAGNPGKVATLTAEVERLQAELAAARAPDPDRTFTPEELHDGTRQRLIRDMLTKADAGASIDEIAAAWNIEAEVVVGWGEDDVEFGAALRRARTRARASIMRTVRQALENGRNLPGSLLDKLLGLYPAGTTASEDDASALVIVDAR